MPFDKVDPKADFPAMERDVLAFWDETKAFDKLREIMGSDLKANYESTRTGDIRHSYASVEKIKKFGYNLSVDFDEGLRQTVKFFA